MNDVVEEAPARSAPAARAGSRDGTQDSHTVRLWVRRALFALLPVALLVAAYEYATGGRAMSTENVYVEADKVGISTDVSGIVATVDVHENANVKAGDIRDRSSESGSRAQGA
jgi:membrane fusion protein, multidrug efflux system